MARKVLPLVLVADDDAAHRLMLATLLEEWGYRVREADDGLKALEFVRETPVDLVVMDMRMPRMDGIESTRLIHGHNPAIPIVVLTAYSSIPSAVEALKSGAFDYLTKPVDFDAFKLVIERALEHTRLKEENSALRQQIARLHTPEIVGGGRAMKRLLEMIALVAPSDATVLITGESGTGKGLIARAIHTNSPRSGKPLVEVNCAAIPETLIESELFGHEKGAFTGADRQRQGRFSQADGGTLFLDEIGELPLPLQAKLLRVLQEGEIQRVGSDASLSVDVRIVAATNRDPERMVADGKFRQDLFYRLNVVTVEAPALRERPEDIPALAQHFLKHFAKKNRRGVKGITPQAMDLLLKYSWPGNVRELENVMERSVILNQGDYVTVEELPLVIQKEVGGTGGECLALETAGSEMTLEDVERQVILKSLKETAGNKSETARRLGITRRTLQLKLKKYGQGDPDDS